MEQLRGRGPSGPLRRRKHIRLVRCVLLQQIPSLERETRAALAQQGRSACRVLKRPFAYAERMVSGALDLGSVEVEIRPRRGGAALVLVAGAVNGGPVRVLGRGAGPEQAE